MMRILVFLALMLLALLLLAGCASYTVACPPPHYADEKVHDELKAIPFAGFEDFWDYMSAMEIQQEALEVCQ